MLCIAALARMMLSIQACSIRCGLTLWPCSLWPEEKEYACSSASLCARSYSWLKRTPRTSFSTGTAVCCMRMLLTCMWSTLLMSVSLSPYSVNCCKSCSSCPTAARICTSHPFGYTQSTSSTLLLKGDTLADTETGRIHMQKLIAAVSCIAMSVSIASVSALLISITGDEEKSPAGALGALSRSSLMTLAEEMRLITTGEKALPGLPGRLARSTESLRRARSKSSRTSCDVFARGRSHRQVVLALMAAVTYSFLRFIRQDTMIKSTLLLPHTASSLL
mmetsp:Transcript_39737/g.77784  ORF Transcript_39737/g.77784 Transcript_39737/m.77784 type:complete len:277 (-) Transcript_39737:594-1424(-)